MCDYFIIPPSCPFGVESRLLCSRCPPGTQRSPCHRKYLHRRICGLVGGWLGGARRMFIFAHCLHPSCVVFLLLGLPLLPFSYGHLHNLPSHPAEITYKMVIKWHPDSQLPNETPMKIQANNTETTETKQSRQPPAYKELSSVRKS